MSEAVLVTGGAGFIGSHLCEALIARGDSVVCYDSFDPFYAPERKERHLAALRDHSRFILVRGDVLDVEKLEATVAGVTRIVHLAAKAGVRPSLEHPALYQQVNVVGTVNLLEAARRTGRIPCVLASSSSVYGANTKVPFEEDDPVLHPISPYAASKRALELAAYTHHHLYGMDIVCHRFFTVYGPRQRPDMAISKFARLVRAGRPIEMFGDGSTRRDYTFVSDIVAGLLASVDRVSGMGYEIFNLGNSQTVSLREMIQAVGQAVGREPQVVIKPPQPGDVETTFASVEKAGRLLGYHPATPLREGLKQYVAWLDAEPPAPGQEARRPSSESGA